MWNRFGSAISRETEQSVPPAKANLPRFNTLLAYPAEVIHVIDGDTFEARVRVWPGLDVSTKVRFAISMRRNCMRAAPTSLPERRLRAPRWKRCWPRAAVTVSRVGIDKYGGRIDALVATRDIPDVSAALLSGGFARSYDGGRRGSWC